MNAESTLPPPPDGHDDGNEFDKAAEHVVRLRKSGCPDDKIWDMLMKGPLIQKWATDLIAGCDELIGRPRKNG